jgi:hypothetical protein
MGPGERRLGQTRAIVIRTRAWVQVCTGAGGFAMGCNPTGERAGAGRSLHLAGRVADGTALRIMA